VPAPSKVSNSLRLVPDEAAKPHARACAIERHSAQPRNQERVMAKGQQKQATNNKPKLTPKEKKAKKKEKSAK
jgi:hypothetical protein